MGATVSEVVQRACEAAFGQPLVQNSLRGLLVEAMIALALEPDWRWCGGDWGSWDFDRADGLRLEVKQSSYRQTWDPPSHGRVVPSFDIRERSGRWEGAAFIEERGRPAQIYVFAYHGVRDQTADHRDPRQWVFYVVPTTQLPSLQRLSLAAVQRLHPGCTFDQLGEEVQGVSSCRT